MSSPLVVYGRIMAVAVACTALAPLTAAQADEKAEPDIYPAPEAAPKELKSALEKASKEHKRVILDFGGNWCGDCRVLDKYFHAEPNASLLKKHFVLVHVNIGNGDKNLDIMEKYGVPISKGVPGLAVVGADGKLLFSQKNGEFESMRRMDAKAVTEFLDRWKN